MRRVYVNFLVIWLCVLSFACVNWLRRADIERRENEMKMR